jgi:hypothetical protein
MTSSPLFVVAIDTANGCNVGENRFIAIGDKNVAYEATEPDNAAKPEYNRIEPRVFVCQTEPNFCAYN